jgi:hypothetical protein
MFRPKFEPNTFWTQIQNDIADLSGLENRN